MLKNVISVIDGEAGSCGKANVIGEIATDKTINLGASVTNCMPNAGHTFVDEKGNATIFRNIPVSIVNPNTELFIGPGSAIDMDVFASEYENAEKFLNGRKIYVHEMVPLIEERHKNYERNNIKSGSTFKGCGAVTQEKVIRDKNLKFFKTFKNAVVCSNNSWLDKLYSHLDNPNEYVLLEGAQGSDLDLNHSGNYPYVTSRNVSTSQLLADSGISPLRLLQTIMVIRPFPIRISNITKSLDTFYTGNYANGAELTWSDVNLGALNGVYPYIYNCPEEIYYELAFHAKSNLDKVLPTVLKMYEKLPEVYKKQLLSGSFKDSLKSGNINLVLALEIERLFHKSYGKNPYDSIVITKINNNGRVFSSNVYTIRDLSEITTVTKGERRIFDLDINQLKNNTRINTPSGLYLNFAQHLDTQLDGLTCNYDNISNYRSINFDNINRYIEFLESETAVPVIAMGTDAKNKSFIKRHPFIKR